MGKEASIYAIIITYNGEQWIRKCLDSIRASSQPLKTIVIDNASADDTTAIIEKEYPEVILHKEDHNLGFGQANNKGIRIARKESAEFILLLNQDAWIKPDMVENLLEALEGLDSPGVLSPVHLNYDGTNLDPQAGGYYQKPGRLFLAEQVFKTGSKAIPIPSMPAALWFIPVKVLETVGGFDPLFFHRGEDSDLVGRVQYHGYKIYLIMNAHGYHAHHGAKSVTSGSQQIMKQFHICKRMTQQTLKHCHNNYLRNCMIDLSELISRMIRHLANGKTQFAIGHLLFLFVWIFFLFKPYKQRKICKEKGPHWID